MCDNQALFPEPESTMPDIPTTAFIPDDPRQRLAAASGAPPAGQSLQATGAFDASGTAQGDASPPAASDRWPRQVEARGRFTLVRPHAGGGLGLVSLARDEDLGREVAVKEIRPEVDRPDARRRFLVEAEITGQLEHPGIVPIYALSYDAAGRPYYAMRFIRGRTLGQALQAFHQPHAGRTHTPFDSLEFRNLLQRLVSVSQTIAYAHSKGIVHRDLKPANIMLGEYGETLVLDWGLAKRLGTQADESAEPPHAGPASQEGSPGSSDLADGSSLTQAGQIVGTPVYMSPEQAAGAEVGPASDVYALGALLYELLTGQMPFSGTPLKVLQGVQAGEYARPTALRRDVPRSLEAVCLKAMSLRANDRYGGAAAFAEELERWLADEPVSATREPLGVRLARWARRHRTLVAASLALLITSTIALGVGITLSRIQQAETEHQKELVEEQHTRAEDNLKLARKAVDECFLLATDDPALKGEHQQPVRRLLLERALPFYEGFKQQQGDEPSLLATAAANWSRIGDSRNALGKRPEALAAQESAVATLRRLVEVQPGEPRNRLALASYLTNLAITNDHLAKYDAAFNHLREARDILTTLCSEHPDNREYQGSMAKTLTNLASLNQITGRVAEAKQTYEQCLELVKRLRQQEPNNRNYLEHQAKNWHNLGNLHRLEREDKRALECYLTSVSILESYVRADSTDVEELSISATIYNALAITQKGLEQPDESLKNFEKAGRIRAQLARDYPQVQRWKYDLAVSGLNLGAAYNERGDHSAAQVSLDQAVETLEELHKAHPATLQYQIAAVAAHLNRGHLLRIRGTAEAEMADYDRAIQLVLSAAQRAPQHPVVLQGIAQGHVDRARTFLRMGRVSESMQAWDVALNLAQGDWKNIVRPGRAACLAVTGKVTQALAEVDAMSDSVKQLASNGEDLAIVQALAARHFANEPLKRDEHVRLAIGHLQRALPKQPGNRPHFAKFLRDTKELDAVRETADFKRVLAAAERE
jgi:serine/threonine-protein kinase